MQNRWQSGWYVHANNNQIAIVGFDNGGKTQGVSYAEGTSLWIKCFEEAEDLYSERPDAGINAIEQGESLNVFLEHSNGSPSNLRYSLSGGKFKVRVHNFGTETINDLQVNIPFENYVISECLTATVNKRQFHNLNLAAGQDVWLDFGDINAPSQMKLPTELCFWTISPNNIPDQTHENDWFCASYTVATQDLSISKRPKLSPNPCDQGFSLEIPADVEFDNVLVYDALGRLQSTLKAEEALFVPTQSWPNGCYWIKAGTGVQKLIVQHE